ncbi:GNAT family N-acetyltransferase [Caenimonas aquaedulcis]|uniref:GNAT family N-acetyltransferase n=1 Tax=Caenimonas aquaedulcis TaxID=2793270 RepID=A0A931MEQ7_9BURK|nr:GNAT family N-acetyltransferase [Caenimonas aquaedulcis]MBG9386836.1 GNAT family N-acetyltransferase [Caenimonas aquaedulcis]
MTEPLLIDLPDTFESERLSMRTPRAGDGAALLPALEESIGQLRMYLGALPWVAADQTLESAEAFCRKAYANFAGRLDFPFLIFEKATGDIAGVVGLHRVNFAVPKAEIGYWVRTSCAGRGYITEAVEAACDYATRHMRAVRLEIVTDEDNLPSRRVAERCGFTLEGTFRHDRRAAAGDLRSTCFYARLP